MRKTFILTVAMLLPAHVYASGSGTTAANFLKIAMSPRAFGVAGAYSAMADDSGAVFVNPAGIAMFEGSQAGIDFASYFQDAKMGNVSYAGDMGDSRFGFGATMFNIGDIEKRGLTDSVGVVPETGTFDSNDMAISLVYAKKEIMPESLPGLAGGFAGKFIRSSIDDKSAMGFAMDAGLIYRAGEKMNLSLVMQNLGTEMKFDEESDPLPLSMRAGVLYRLNSKFNAVGELTEYFADEKMYAAVGGEYWFRDALALRGGYKFGYDTENLGAIAGLSLGFGMKVEGIGVDYAYLPFGDLGNIHRFGFWLQF